MYKDTRRGTRGYKVRHKRIQSPAQEDTKTGIGGHKDKHRRTQEQTQEDTRTGTGHKDQAQELVTR